MTEKDLGNIDYIKRLKSHTLKLLIVGLVLSIIYYNTLANLAIYLILHLGIEFFVSWMNEKIKRKSSIHVLHQTLHIALIFFVGEILVYNNFDTMQYIPSNLLRWILFLILILKPVNISFKILFNKYAPEKSIDNNDTIKGAGAMIGNLERILIAILLYYNQFGAIGLVFTAKSVARFDKISKNPNFAEYYLIGSLYSIISVLFCYGIITNF